MKVILYFGFGQSLIPLAIGFENGNQIWDSIEYRDIL